MKINSNDIRTMVMECVKSILNERRGAIEDSMRGLAIEIINRIRNGENDFHIDFDELSKYVPERYLYKNEEIRPKWAEGFNIKVCYIKNDIAAWNWKINTLEINLKYITKPTEVIIEYLMHEFTHMVNDKCSPNEIHGFEPNASAPKLVREIFYYFSPSEMQSRLSQFKIWLENHPQNTFESAAFNADNILNISFMETIINYINGMTFDDKSKQIVDILVYIKLYNSHRRNGKSNKNYEYGIPPKEFEKAKDSLVKTYENRYISYVNKVRKIYNDSLQ